MMTRTKGRRGPRSSRDLAIGVEGLAMWTSELEAKYKRLAQDVRDLEARLKANGANQQQVRSTGQ